MLRHVIKGQGQTVIVLSVVYSVSCDPLLDGYQTYYSS